MSTGVLWDTHMHAHMGMCTHSHMWTPTLHMGGMGAHAPVAPSSSPVEGRGEAPAEPPGHHGLLPKRVQAGPTVFLHPQAGVSYTDHL